MAEYKTLSELERENPGYWEPTLTSGMLSQLKNIGTPVWSPDGHTLFYPQDYNGRTDIIRLDLETGVSIQLTSDVEAGGLLRISQSALDVSPDGAILLYMSGKDGKLWCIPVRGGVAKRLTLQGEGLQFSASFSPDGKQVAYVTGYGDRIDLAVCDSDGESWGRKLNKTDHIVFDPQWVPGGKYLIYGEYDNRKFWWSETSINLLNLQTGESKTLVDGWGKNRVNDQPRPSPDGKWLAYVTEESGWANVQLLNLETGQATPFASAEFEQGEPVWSLDGRGIAYTVNRNCNVGISYTTCEGQTLVIENGEAVCTGLVFSPDGKRLAYLKQSVNFPPNIFVYDLALNTAKQVTHNTIGGLEQSGLVKAEAVHWTSPDGLNIEGLLFRPRKELPGKHPLLLHLHGGPVAQYNRRWDGSVQYWVNRGWAVIEPNFRGSTGYGRTFRNLLNGAWGNEDMLDNIGAVDYLTKEGLVNPRKVVAWGGSGGGYATMLLLGKFPELFKAGVALVGVSNFASFPDQTDRLARYLMQDLLGARPENYDLYVERSPVTYAANIKAPLLIMMGAEDKRVPAKQGEEMVDALKKAGKSDFEYVAYEGEGHGWRKSENIQDYYRRMERFLKHWVLERT
ncbi:MAG: S9 family peptidase [Chloroflexi bacterium]|uniref:S9 family peptidase n=1 Tax=Candidatus Chlorohelix allophototropha TaxID=3003348 RepID=A0A8T7M7X2_9CHLR|nr:S9 family peptidase [Chloroflexota bacterium]WJW67993.1 S9 family peptidase [Chloroflexota bacterium L227-S17]